MSRRSPLSPALPTESPADRLQATVDAIADDVRVVTDIVDQIREDLSWLTRNGLPHQPLTVAVHRMPLLPDKEQGAFQFSLLSPLVRDPTVALTDEQVRMSVIDQVVERLAEPLGVMAQEQLNQLLGVLDHSHRQILRAIRSPQPPESIAPTPTRTSRKRKPAEKPGATTGTPTAANPPEPPPAPGQLF
jgi:hypothetical protein